MDGFSPVTDPELLQQLDDEPSGFAPVQDPELLAELDKPEVDPDLPAKVDQSWAQRGRQFVSGIVEPFAALPESAAITAGSAESKLGDGEGFIPPRERDTYKYGESIRGLVKDTIGAPDPRDDSFMGQLAYGAGNLIGMGGSAIASGFAAGPWTGLAVGAAQGAAMNQAQVYKEAIDAGVDEQTAIEASDWATAVGATEVIPISRALRLMPAGVRREVTGALMKRLVELGKNGAEEATQEFLAQVGNNIIAQQYYDPQRGWSEGATEAALIGAILGTAAGGAGMALERKPVEKVDDVGPSDEQKDAIAGATAPAPPAADPVDPAVAQAVTETPVAPPAAPKLTPKAEQLREMAKRRDKRAKGQVPPEVTPATTSEQSQPVSSPTAAGTEPPTAVGAESAAPPASPAAQPNDEITANVPEPEPEPMVPEADATINIQRTELLDPEHPRIAVQYPKGTVMKNFPKPDSPRIERYPTGKNGTFDFDASKISRDEIRARIKAGTIGEILDLGPYNKEEVAQSAAAGNPELAVTERTPDGTEVSTAVGTTETAPEQIAALEETKAAPENTIMVETPEAVIADRVEAANAAPEAAPVSKADQAKATSKARTAEAEAAPAKPRVLADLSLESRKAQQEQAEQNEIVADRVKKWLKGRGKEKTLKESETETVGKSWTPAERAARRQLNEESEKVASKFAPTVEISRMERDILDEDVTKQKNARAAVRARAEAMLSAADEAGVTLPDKVYDNTDTSMNLGAGAMNLIVARDFLKALKSPYKEVEEHYIDFLSRDARLRKGLLDEVVSERRTEIDDKMRQGQGGNIEQIAANPIGDTSAEADTELSADTRDVANPNIVGKDDIEVSRPKSAKLAPRIDDGTQKGEITVKTKDDKVKKVTADVAKPASEVRSVSAEEKAKIEAQLRAMGILKREAAEGSSIARRPLREDEVIFSEPFTVALDRIGKISGNELNKKIIRKILDRMRGKIGDVDVRVVEQDTLDDMFDAKRPGQVNGYYDTEGGYIVISGNFLAKADGKFDASLLAHEGVHAYLQEAIKSDATLQQDIQEILNYVRSLAPSGMKNVYGLKNIQEFIAEALSNPKFQNFLMAQKIPDSMRSKYDAPKASIWQKLVRAIAEHMGFTSGKEIDALSYTMRLVERAEDARAQLTSEGNVTPILKWFGKQPEAQPDTKLFSGTPEKFAKDAKSWTTAGEAADWLVANSRDEATREIIAKIRPAIENSLFKVVGPGDVVPGIVARNLNSGAMGVYWSKFDTNERGLYVRDNFLTEEVVAHELLHAATNTRLREGNLVKNKGTELAQITAEFYELQRVVVSRYNQLVRGKVNPEITQSLQIMSAVSSVEELATYGLTNAKVQEFFKSIPYRGGSVFTKFVDNIRRLFGIPKSDTNALTKIIELTERLVDTKFEQDTKPFAGETATPAMRERSYAEQLTDAGVPEDVAAELDAFINAELGKSIDPATLNELLEDFKAEFGQDTSASNEVPKEQAEEKAKQTKSESEKQAKRMMRDTTKSRDELLDEAYLKALEDFKPGRVPKQNSKVLLSLLMNNQLALISDNFFGRNTNPVRRIADLIEKRRTTKQRYTEELGAVAQKLYDTERQYRKENPEAWENFVSLAHDATMAQVHPDKPLDHDIHKYLGGKDALGGKWSKKQHPRLAAVYNSLPADLKALYRETRDALSATRDRVELGNISAVLRKMGHNDEALAKRFLEKKSTEADRKLVGDVVADYIENIVRLSAINGPYFNLARQGDIVLTGRYKVTTPSNGKKIKDGVFEFKTKDEAVKFAEEQMLRPTISRVAIDPKTGERYFVDDDGTQVKATFSDPSAEERYRVTVQTKYVEFFHSEAAAREKAEALKDAVELNDVEPKRVERAAANADMLSDQMRALASTLDTRLKGANLTPEQQSLLKGTLNEASLRFMASTRLQTHRLPRRYVQGASKDLVVSTYQYVDSSAGYLAKLDTQVELEDAMRQMEKGVNALKSRREGIGGGARAISNEIERRVNDIDYNMDQGLAAAAANRIMAVNFINHLMSPMYTVLQVVQTPFVAGPVLSGEYGNVRTAWNLMKASKDIGAAQIGLKGLLATAKGLAGVNTPGRAYTDYAKARLSGEEQRAIDRLIELGVVDADAGFDVTRLERKDNKLARAVDATLEYFSNIARAAPQSIEAINRSVTGLAVFRMARKDGLSFEEAVRKAQEAVELTHFNLSASNSAPIFRNPVGRLLLQFKKYGQNIYFLHYYNAARLFRPKNKGDAWKGAKTLLLLAATHQMAAGLVGWPIEPLKIAVLVLGMIPGMPEWEDLERLAEEALAEAFGEKGAEAMMYGLPRLANIDISSRVGLSSLLLFGEPGEMGDKDSVQAWFLNLFLGPTVGSATDIAGGIGAIAEGDPLKAAEKLLPVKVISDSLRAVREADEGKFDTQDALMRAFGVQSARQARIQQKTSADIDRRAELKREKNAIIKAWITADTPGERTKLIARMREYNKEAGKRDKLSTKFLNNIKRREEQKYQDEE